MTTTRRDFIKLVTTTGGALVLGVRIHGETSDESADALSFEPNAWVTIHSDGTIMVRVGKSEMGQGVRTSLPVIVAEELDADLGAVKIEQASPGPDFQGLGTGGSGSIMRSWDPLREAGATARAMLVAAAATRWGVEPSSCRTARSVVTHEPSGRKASYGELAAAAAKLTVPADVPLKKREDYRLIGKSRKRVDGPDIITGRARFGLDTREEGQLYAVVARPPSFGATLEKFDARKARARKGVVDVFEIPSGVAVVATNTWSALRGREDLDIDWTRGDGSEFESSEHSKNLRSALDERGIVIRQDGEGSSALDRAERTIEAIYEYPYEAHASVEPVNSTVLVEDDHCTIWSPTQTPNSVQAVAAHVLEMDPSKIDVHVVLIGGGFGRRLGHDFDWEAIEIAKKLKGKPVKLFWSREDDIRHGYFQAASAHRLIAGVDGSGKVTTWIHRKASSPHNARYRYSDEDKKNPDIVRGWTWGVYDTPYFAPAMEMSYRIVEAPVPIGPWRAVFSPPSVFARESFVDELAVELGRDPLDLRLELLGRDDESIPSSFTIDGDTVDRPRLRRCLEAVAKLSGWDREVAKGRARGLACNVFHTGTYVAYVVEVSRRRVPAPGELPFRVEKVACAIDCGVAINPRGVEQQVESGILWSLSNMKSEITFRDGAARESNYADFPVAMIGDTPAVIDVEIIDGDDVRPHGIGEPTVCPFAPAVANALSRLTGRRIRKLPVGAEMLSPV